MNFKKVIITVFVGIKIFTIWCHQADPTITASMHIPKSLVAKQSFDCVLASDFNKKTECVRQGYVLLGSVQNPSFENTHKKDMRLLQNQKYGFIFYKVPQQEQEMINRESKHDLLVDIPEQELIRSIKSQNIQILI